MSEVADSTASASRSRPLHERLPSARDAGIAPEEVLDRFLGWVSDQGLEPYPAQEQALLELLAGHHVVLGTPTGSGKSLVALALHFKALCEGRRSFYTAPIKALASEKFFSLCRDLGPQNVGMLTGDASINPEAPLICCTAEVLANMALRQGEALDAPYVVMDEFHYYADRDRGIAWQIPLIALPRTLFLLMSATLGDTSAIERRLRERSGREVASIQSDVRPVPLDYQYRETALHATIESLLAEGRAPVYVVHFTQREAAEQAQALTSLAVCEREERRRIGEALEGFRFDTAYGKDMQRVIRHGIGLHHAGLLPRYRLLVERLAQRALLKVVCGTDTLGVGINVPIRTVLFSGLVKYDGEKVGILRVREFKQIAGRAGRRGFDTRGSVVCQAPERVIASRKQRERDGKPARHRAPQGQPSWNRETFERLIARPPEALVSRFEVTHGMVLNVLQREEAAAARAGAGYRALVELVDLSHETPVRRARLRREAAVVFRALRAAGILEVAHDAATGRRRVRVAAELQADFSLHQTLSLYLVEALDLFDPESLEYPLQVLSLVESILENPMAILLAQLDKRKRELLAKLKAEGVPYEDRIRELDGVEYAKPEADLIYESFNAFAAAHPWVAGENIRPKSIAREMFESWWGFDDYVRECGIQRSEGLLLRYLSQAYNTLVQSVPTAAKTEGVHDVLAYLGTLLEGVDASLVEQWQSLFEPEARLAVGASGRERAAALEPRIDPKALRARVRAELRRLVRALAARAYEEAALCVRQHPDDAWDAARFERELAPFHAEYGELVFTPQTYRSEHTLIRASGPTSFDVVQVLVDPQGDNTWCIEGEVSLPVARGALPPGPLARVLRIRS